jgi:hypothetical protein
MFSVIYRKAQTFAMNFMLISLCEFHVMLEYDEMNCNIVLEFFTMYLKCGFWLYEITMNLVF